MQAIYVRRFNVTTGEEIGVPVFCGDGREGRKEAAKVIAFRLLDDILHNTESIVERVQLAP